MRFFPKYNLSGTPPRRLKQRIGTGGYTEYKGSSSDGGGGVKIGVIDNANDSYDAYGYISFDTGHSSQVYKGFLAGTTDEVTSPSSLGQYGQVMMGTPIFHTMVFVLTHGAENTTTLKVMVADLFGLVLY